MDTKIVTATGRLFDLANPSPSDVHLQDIACHLAQICRFTGATRHHYSVAQHCVLVAECVPFKDRLAALLHDAAEAYLGDVSAPLKALLPDYRRLEATVHAAICASFGIPAAIPATVQDADARILHDEACALLPSSPYFRRDKGLGVSVQPWPIPRARAAFVETFWTLQR